MIVPAVPIPIALNSRSSNAALGTKNDLASEHSTGNLKGHIENPAKFEDSRIYCFKITNFIIVQRLLLDCNRGIDQPARSVASKVENQTPRCIV